MNLTLLWVVLNFINLPNFFSGKRTFSTNKSLIKQLRNSNFDEEKIHEFKKKSKNY